MPNVLFSPPPPPPAGIHLDSHATRRSAAVSPSPQRALHAHLITLLVALLPAATAHAQSAPAAPTGLAAAPLDASAALTWNDPSDSTITGYSVRSSTSLPVSGTWTAIASSGATTTSHTVASLTNGTRYYFEIRATNANGNSSASSTATIQLAASPSTAVSITDANLRTALETATGKAVGATITQLDMAKLTSLDWVSGVSSVSGLEHAVNVLRLALNGSISDVTPLSGLTALRRLDLSFNSISDVTPLAGLTALTTLNLRSNSISNVLPLASLTSLWNLHLPNNSISNVSPLASLTSLRSLDLNKNLISDPSPLASLTSLRYIFLDGNPISQLSDVPLASFSSLRGLGLSGDWISDSLLARLGVNYPTLERLRLNGGSISDLTALTSLTSLFDLHLQDNAILDLSPIADLTSLRWLHLEGNSISNLSPLAGLTSLSELILNRNLVSDLSPLAGLARLRSLTAYQNSISDLSPLAGLTALRSLELRDNLISDVSPLTLNPGLASGSHIWIGSNPLSTASFNAHIPALRARGATVWWPDPLPTNPPAVPRLVVDRTQSTGAATIRWRDPVDHAIVRYELRRAAGPAPAGSAFGEWAAIAGSNKRTTDHAVYVSGDGWHTFEVRAVNAVGSGTAARFQLLVGANNSPVVTGSISDASLAPGEPLVVDITGYFSDADFTDTLTFSAASSRSAVATVRLDGTTLTVTAVAEGQAQITVRARDNYDATASLSFLVTVGNPVSIGGGDDAAGAEAAVASAPEGGVAEVAIAMAAARTVDVSFAYSFGPDDDPATADADAADHGGEGGTVTVPAGETEATISIPILDDDDIEPARESFVVTLTPTDGVGVAVSSATVHIAEGVCDRTWQVADALRGGRACEAVTPAELARRRTVRLRDAGLVQLQPLDFLGLAGMTVLILDDNGLSALPDGLLAGSPNLRVLRLRGNRFETLPTLGSAPALIELDLTGNLLTELPAQPFANLPALGYLYLGENQIDVLPADLLADAEAMRILELQDNALATLPEGLFAGVPKLFSLQLQGNPGAPFPLAVELARVQVVREESEGDAGEDEPGRAEIQLRVPHGAPFPIDAAIAAPGATHSAQTATIAAGKTLGTPVSVVRNVAGNEADAAVTVEITSAPNLPTTTCGDDFDEYRCFRGFQLAPGGTLMLFEPRPVTAISALR